MVEKIQGNGNKLYLQEKLKLMKTKLIFLLLVLVGINANAQLNYQWAFNPESIYAPGGDVVGTSIKSDALGNTYVTGFFQGTADFDPTDVVMNLTSAGSYDIFLAKYNSIGNLVFAKGIGGTGDDRGNGLVLDNSGNIFFTGNYSTTADFNPGVGNANLTPMGGNDVFIAEFDAVGNYIWAKSIGGNGDDVSNGIVMDAANNIYISGYFNDTADFDSGVGIANIVTAGNYDAFIAKYSGSGNYIFAKNIGGSNSDAGYSIAIDASSNIFITGSFSGAADFDPSAGVANLISNGLDDIFLAKYDISGNYLFANKIGGTGNDEGYSITTDIAGNVLLTGSFKNTVDFDPGAGIVNLVATGINRDMFLAKYSSTGSYIYAMRAGGVGYAEGDAITTDAGGNVYIMGLFHDTTDFDIGAGVANLFAQSPNPSIFIAKYDAAGNYINAFTIAQLPGAGSTTVYPYYALNIDASGNVYVTGDFGFISDFDPGPNYANLISAQGQANAFVAKYDNIGNYIWASAIGGNSVTPPAKDGLCIKQDKSGNVYVLGLFKGRVDFDPGPGVAILTALVSDFFIAKYDSLGNYIYAKGIIGTNGAGGPGASLAIDDSGNVYIAGEYGGMHDFDPGPNNVFLYGGGMFIAKYDAFGNYVFAKAIGIGATYRVIKGIAVDSLGNTFITGYYDGTCDFDPGAGVANLTSNGGQDIFFAKYDALGNYVYAKSIGGLQGDQGFSIAVDSIGNTYITGYFKDIVDFDPNAGVANLTAVGFAYIFYAKYDPMGNYIYARGIGGTATCEGHSIAIDKDGNAYVTGKFSGTVDFDPSASVSNLSSGVDFIAKYDAIGNYVYAIGVGGNPMTIALDAKRNAYITGYLSFGVSQDFDPGAGVVNLTSVGNNDVYFAKYDSLGNYVVAKLVGGTNNDYVNSLSSDGKGSICITGYFSGTADFNPDAGVSNLLCPYNTGGAFIARYSDGASPTVGTHEIPKEENGIIIYPNPFTEQTTISFTEEQNTSSSSATHRIIKITDVLGREIKTINCIGKKCVIEKGEMRAGVYFVEVYFDRLNNPEQVVRRKIVVQ